MAILRKPFEAGMLRGPSSRFDHRALVPAAVVLVLGLLVLYPAFALTWDTFHVVGDKGVESWGFANWTDAWGQSEIIRAIRTTILITLTTELVALPLGIGITWAISRTDIRGRELMDLMFWVAFFLPSLPVITGWILLADPSFGLLNTFVSETLHLGVSPFNLYSFWGIIWVHLVTKSIAAKYILLSPAFKNMDSSLEDSSRVCGVSPFLTIVRVVIPMMKPAIIISFVLSLIYSIESFETELILGAPANIDVYSTKMYGLTHQMPPDFGAAKVLGVSILFMMIPLIVVQMRYGGNRKIATLSSRYQTHRMRLGRLRTPLTVLIYLFIAVVTIVPLVLLVLGTFMQVFGFFDIPDPWTTEHWSTLFHDPALRDSFLNSLKLGLGAASLGTIWYAVVAFVAVRSRSWVRGAIDFLSWLPVAIPGLILGLGLLSLVLDIAMFRSLYGSTTLLTLAIIIAGMTTGVQVIKSNLLQLNNEIEEASAVCGGSAWYTYRRITLPILAPALFTVGVITFASATSNVAHVAMLSTGKNDPLAILQLQYMTVGQYETASIVGVVIVAMSTSFALLSRFIAVRFRTDQ